ncbi:eCIS core domain-containing protein [Corallococcus carmarthensis]|uniref:eCIS core domain-containing protein n=1 Tax=Corallococcus carmarthensis TaxID=2316728 RepID=UPI001ABFFEA1|nr:DUF4157 domain-containing protein [Corallococcus carmarthensis]
MSRHGGGTRDVQVTPETGAPLPARLRTRMEAFWGQDLSQVRIHVHPGLSVAAVTVGSDIWFAPGQYDPVSRRGLQLLAHELTHVLQQRAGRVRPPPGLQSAIVQEASLEAEADRMGAHAAAFALRELDGLAAPPPPRARAAPGGPRVGQCMPFGVEFECGSIDILSPRKKSKGTVIWRDGRTFKAVYEPTSAKLPVVEFVSDPPADSLEQLIATASRMATLARTWDEQFIKNAKGEKDSRLAFEGLKERWELEKKGPIDGAVQVTIGVPLECVPQIYGIRCFDNYGDAKLHDKMSTHWNTLRTRVRAGNEPFTDGQPVPGLPAETWGFIWIVIDYLIRAGDDAKKPFIKAKFDTLSRTDFRTLFSLLPQAEQDRLSCREGGKQVMKKEWTAWLMKQALLAAKPAARLAHHEILIELSKQMIPWHKVAHVTPTFNDWLKNIPNQDLFTAERNDLLIGLGAMGNRVDLVQFRGAQVASPIFEVRAPLGSSIHYSLWKERMGELWEKYQRVLAVPAQRPAVQRVQAAIRAQEEREAQEAVRQRARAQAKAHEALLAARNRPAPPVPPVPPSHARPPVATAAPAPHVVAQEAARPPSVAVRQQAPFKPKRSIHDAKNRDLD